jgi:hypothetical protein
LVLFIDDDLPPEALLLVHMPLVKGKQQNTAQDADDGDNLDNADCLPQNEEAEQHGYGAGGIADG